MTEALILILGYLVGSIPVGVIVAKSKGIDIMSVGSGNIGATNVARTLGRGLGFLVFGLDVLKGVLPAIAGAHFVGPELSILAGVAAVLGHTFSPFLKFKGGKGIATGLGALLGSAPLAGLAGFGVFLVVFLLTRIVSISSLVAGIGVLTAGFILDLPSTFFFVFGPLVAWVFYKHKPNIQRLLKGEEPKLDLSSKFKKKEGS